MNQHLSTWQAFAMKKESIKDVPIIKQYESPCVKIAQILVNYYSRPMLFKDQATSEVDTLSTEKITNIAMEQFHLYAKQKW
jgi:hypothetical protein